MQTHNCCGLCRIELKDLSVKSDGETLLYDINLSLCCGQLTALIGKNGAGKTTLLKTLLGEKAYNGEISYHRQDGRTTQKPQVGYVPQQLVFDKNTPISVLDFMMAGKGTRPVFLGHSKKARQQAARQLEQLQCEHLLDKSLGNLSGGELQRVMLAMAVDPIPDLLILDEPVSGMDVTGLDLFYQLVTDLRNQYHMSIILVSHDFSLIKKYADDAVLLDKTILAQGPTAEVFQTDAFLSAFGFLGAI